MKNTITLKDNNSIVTIEKGELISFKVNNKEYMHQKGNKGWRKSDDEMFPVIGPLSKNNYRLHTKKGDAILDQHGLLREMEYVLFSSDKSMAKFRKVYAKNTPLQNAKFPNKSTEEFVFWPFDFTFEKHFTLKNNVLTINFTLTSEAGMPYMLGYHPAFLLSNTGTDTLTANDKKITLPEIYKAGHNAFPVLNTNKIILENTDRNHLEITTKNFNNFMLWTPVDNMLCIEPITQYTSYTDEKFSEQNMSISSGKESFSFEIKVL
ncbi:aldose 1-epimerase [uncultured Polaribacter sp.]|uniref:aldose 1-epimerase n=1 Tax=uncultured Polaribacter sp. TaxID=174711 RepID=UPI0026079EC3|nr:aldose 1-epimerase [uncultured Polaribacter sp.]